MTRTILGRLHEKVETRRRIGLFRSARIARDRLFLGILARIYEFHPWHAESPTSARTDRHTVAQVVNELKPRIVVEVGCGLGEILRLVQAPQRYGFDLDEGVVRAARFLHGDDIAFQHGQLSSLDLPRIDVLILVNWIHALSPATLEAQLDPLLSRTKHLLLDALDPDGPAGYRFKHDFGFLEQRARRLSVTRPPEEGRSFHLFEVHA